jgi:hypothetical protein
MSNYEARLPFQPERLRFHQRTSLLLEATALAQGLDTLRVGIRGFTAGAAPSYSDIGFQDTLSHETSRAAVRTGGDRLMRKIALSEAKVAVPPSRRFDHEHAEEAVEYARQFRRGVLIKPISLDAGPISLQALKEPDELRENIGFWVGSADNPAPYLVERRMFGREYAFYVVGGEVISVVRLRDRRWEEEIYRAGVAGFGEIQPQMTSWVLQAFRALPAMPHGVVHLVCSGTSFDSDGCVVVSASPSISLLRRRQPLEWSANVAEQLISHAVRNVPAYGTNRDGPISLEFTMNDVSDPRVLTQGIQDWLVAAGIDGYANPGDRDVTGALTAFPGQAVTLSGLSQAGKVSTARPQTVALYHANDGSPV